MADTQMASQDPVAAAAKALATLDVEHLLLPVLFQLALIVGAARAFGLLARRVWQPTAVGEIVAGLLLGPSLFGWLFPDLWQSIFFPSFEHVPPALAKAAFSKIFTVLAQIGLVLLLFLIGLEFDFGHLRQHAQSAVLIALVSTAVPLALGLSLAPLIYGELEAGPKGAVPPLGMALFLGVALSITALPILGRIMVEMGIHRTRLAAITITAAAIGDAIGWILLASVQAVVQSQFNLLATLSMLGMTVAFGLLVLFIVRPFLVRYLRWALAGSAGALGLTPLAVVLIALLLCAAATNMIGIFAIFGAFLLGAVLSDQHAIRDALNARMRDFTTAFFLPIFFTFTGLRTEVAAVHGGTLWLIFAVVLTAAILGKFGGAWLAARLSGMNSREAGIIGTMMNTRALMELIVINVGYDIGVLPRSLFCMLVMMAIITTIMTAPIMLALRRRTEIEEPLSKSGFLRG